MSDVAVTGYRCPVCRTPLGDTGSDLVCAANHRFNVAREGYVNLLTRHLGRAHRAGDSVEMVRARRQFLDGGHYLPLREALRRAVSGSVAVLDVGCGEGYFAQPWSSELAGYVGVDLSKEAVRLASTRCGRRLAHAVASAYDLPLADAAMECAVVVFGPLAVGELTRVLRPGSRLLVLSPEPDHLVDVRHLLDLSRRRPAAVGDAALRHAGFTRQSDEFLRYRVDLDRTELITLVQMTPWWRHLDSAQQQRLTQSDGLSVTVSVVLRCYIGPPDGV